MFVSPIPDHLSHRNTLNHVGVWKKKIGHGRSVVILQPCVDVLSLINKPEEKKTFLQKHNQSKNKNNIINRKMRTHQKQSQDLS